MSESAVELPSLFRRFEQRPSRADTASRTSHRTSRQPLTPVGRLRSPGVVEVPSTPDEMVVERLRIAFAVNDTVIRHLFSIGLGLHTTRTMVSDLARVRLDATIGELDMAISELRSLIFDLETVAAAV